MKKTTTMKLKFAIFLICCFLAPVTTSGQKRIKKITVTGTVIDETGLPLKGVSIFIDNGKPSTVTDVDGTYKIKVKPTAKTISAISFENGVQIMDYDKQTEMNFTLAKNLTPAEPEMNKVGKVVDIGYQTAEKEKLTTNVGSVNMDRASKSNYTSIYDMISGEVPGVVVSGTSIRVRMGSSINSSNEPLFVVDGLPTYSIENVNPNDVASISVLKDASASIYGSRASNGVILIKLK